MRPLPEGTTARWLGQRRDEREAGPGRGGEVARPPQEAGGAEGLTRAQGLRGNQGGGPQQGRGAGRPGRRAPEKPVNGGSRVRAEVGPVKGWLGVAAEAGQGARALLTGLRAGAEWRPGWAGRPGAKGASR